MRQSVSDFANMRGATSIIVLIGLAVGWCTGQYLNNRPYPTYSLESMPDTDFTCRDKILGGYYADSQTQCQMFHVCVKVAGIGVQDFRFLCPNGTAFDQDHQICAEWDDVDCDATTLYYASDNFDLYRLGSGFESKAVKYGEEEETFSLQRAETGDARLNREHQASRINQQREFNTNHHHHQIASPQRRQQNNERDIFKTSSSSNFFNNRNGGKEIDDADDDEEEVSNVNQHRDSFQTRKLVRKQQPRRPVEQPSQKPTSAPTTTQTQAPPRVQRPTGFINNFAGSSPVDTVNQHPDQQRARSSGQRRPVNRQYNDVDSFRQQTTPLATVSTPAPFRQTPSSTTFSPKPTPQTENYPSNFNNKQQPAKTTSGFDTHYDVPKIKSVGKPVKDSFLPTTYAPKVQYTATQKQATQSVQLFNNQFQAPNVPKQQPQPFATVSSSPREQQQPSTHEANHFSRPFANQFNSNQQQPVSSTAKSIPHTQYTPTVPKVTSTTPTPRANRYDETHYDDGSYNPRYEQYDDRTSSGQAATHKDDEFLKTAHSQNIASSRNEFVKSAAAKQQPRPFASSPTTINTKATENYPKTTKVAAATPKPEKKQLQVTKEKNVSYDYAYYDSNVGPEPEYDIDTEFKRTSG